MELIPPSAKALITECRNQGYIARRLYVMETQPVDAHDLGKVFSALVSHLQYWVDLETKGILFAAGPVLPVDEDSQWSGAGIVIFRAGSLREAESIAAEDPMHTSGARKFALRPWLLNHMNAALGPG